jgi:hypothetical protein
MVLSITLTALGTIAMVYGVLRWSGVIKQRLPRRGSVASSILKGSSPLRWVGIGGGLLLVTLSHVMTSYLLALIGMQAIGVLLLITGIVLFYFDPTWALPAWMKQTIRTMD